MLWAWPHTGQSIQPLASQIWTQSLPFPPLFLLGGEGAPRQGVQVAGSQGSELEGVGLAVGRLALSPRRHGR